MSILSINKPQYKECLLDNNPIDSIIVFNSKLFHGDICKFTNNSITDIISKRNAFLIGGVLKLNSNIYYKENSKSLIKTSFSCTKEKQMGLIIEISSVSNKIELPIEIIQSDQPVYITIDNKEKKSEILKLNFSVLKDKKNIAHVNINRNDFLELAKSDFEVSIKTIDGLFSAKINSNDSDTINFINNCI